MACTQPGSSKGSPSGLAVATNRDGACFGGLGELEVMSQSLEAMRGLLTRYRMAGQPPDVAVTVPFDACGSIDFYRASEMIDVGRALTVTALANDGIGPDPG